MKEGIHPTYERTTIRCACGNVIETRSTKKDIRVESLLQGVTPSSPGKQKMVDTRRTRSAASTRKFGLEN